MFNHYYSYVYILNSYLIFSYNSYLKKYMFSRNLLVTIATIDKEYNSSCIAIYSQRHRSYSKLGVLYISELWVLQ